MIRKLYLVLLFLFFPISAAFAQGFTPNTQLCTSNNVPINGSTEPIAQCNPVESKNSFDYIIPCQDKTKDNTNCNFGAFVYGEGFAHVGDVNNTVYSQNGYAVQTSNNQSLLYKVVGSNLMFVQDTTWSNSEMCHADGNGPSGPAFQRMTNGGSAGMLWAPKQISCTTGGANQFHSAGTNHAYRYKPEDEEALRGFTSSVTSCESDHGNSNVSGDRRIIFNGPAKCGSYTGDMLVLYNASGAGAGEVFFYCKGKGLCAWYQKIDFSKSGAQPKNWTASTDICQGFKGEYAICRTQCPAGGIAKAVELPVSDQLQNLLVKALFNVTLHNVEGKGTHQTSIEQKDYLKPLSRTLLPGSIDYHPSNAGNYDAPAPAGKTLLKGNGNQVSKTQRTALEAAKDASVQNGSVVATSGQVVSSEDRLNSNQNCEDCVVTDDNTKIIGSITSVNRMASNIENGIDLTKPNQILDDNIPVPCDGSEAVTTRSIKSTPNGDNKFTSTGNPIVDIEINIVSGIADFIAQLAKTIGLDGALETTIATSVKMCMCTKISNEDDMEVNSRTSTYASMPSELTSILDNIVKNGKQVNTYSIPSDANATVEVEESHSYGNHILTSLEYDECLSMNPEMQVKLGYAQRCGTPVQGTIAAPPADSGQPIDCSIASFQKAFGDQAQIAACVAQHESSCKNPVNKSCLKVGGSWDYSFGPFQINLLAHPANADISPPSLFHNPDGSWKAGIPPGTWTCKQGFSTIGSASKKGGRYPTMDIACQVGNPAIIKACEDYFSVPANNMEYAALLVKRYGWRGPWAADANACGF